MKKLFIFIVIAVFSVSSFATTPINPESDESKDMTELEFLKTRPILELGNVITVKINKDIFISAEGFSDHFVFGKAMSADESSMDDSGLDCWFEQNAQDKFSFLKNQAKYDDTEVTLNDGTVTIDLATDYSGLELKCDKATDYDSWHPSINDLHEILGDYVTIGIEGL